MMNRKILITGAPGWLGTRLSEILHDKKRDFRCLVLPGIDASHLKKLNCEIATGDITKKERLKNAVKDIDIIIHCAGIIHPKKAKDFYEINRDGTKNLIEVANENNVKKIIYVSSNSAQGHNVQKEILMKEDDEERPYTDYGKSKYQAEQIVKENGIEYVIVRPCWFYGPRQPERMTKLMNMIKNEKPLMFGDGENLRSMTYIDNLIDAFFLIEKNWDIAKNNIFWIADEKPHKTIDIYNQIAKELGVELNPRNIPAFISKILEKMDSLFGKLGMYKINIHVGGEMSRNIACSIQKAKKILGYEPKVSFEEGIKKSVEWTKKEKLV